MLQGIRRRMMAEVRSMYIRIEVRILLRLRRFVLLA
jgi:hypothetical protein